jgi:hypothetical protein
MANHKHNSSHSGSESTSEDEYLHKYTTVEQMEASMKAFQEERVNFTRSQRSGSKPRRNGPGQYPKID